MPAPPLQNLRELEVSKNSINSTFSVQTRKTCPIHLNPFISQLLLDLPNYVNRVLQRRSPSSSETQQTYMILAEKAEFEPLPINPEISNTEQVHQVFITTVERQYKPQKLVQIQRYHWIFLQRTEQGWQLIKMFSKSSPNRGSRLLGEPRDTSKDAIAEAIRLWLRDCQKTTQGTVEG